MPAKLTTFLMFQGDAEEAITWYTSLFDDGEILEMSRYGSDAPGREGTVERAMFTIAGQVLMCIDSPAVHDFTFTPSISLYVKCGTEEEIERLADALGEGGTFMMPLDSYPFSTKFCWLADRFGVSWQLDLG